MKPTNTITLDAGTFSALLSKVAPAIAAKSTLPILESVLLDCDGKTLTARGGNLDQFIQTSAPCAGKFRAAVPFVELKKIVDSLDGEIMVTANTETKRLTITRGDAVFKYPCNDPDEYPQAQKQEAGTETEIDAAQLVRMLEHTRFCTSTDETRPSMQGVYFDFNAPHAVATDGHRLSEYGTDKAAGVVVPARACDMILKLFRTGTLTVTQDAAQLTITDGTQTLGTRLIDEPYPNYRAVIPELADNIVAANRTELLTVTRRVLQTAHGETHKVTLNFGADRITVAADNIDNGSEGVDYVACNHAGAEMLLALNGSYLDSALSHLESKDVALHLTSPSRAVLVRALADAEPCAMLIMPVTLNS